MLVDVKNVIDTFNVPKLGVYHVGAHYGQEIEIYEKLSLHNVVMFEPSKKNFEILQERVGSRAKLVNLGLGSSEEEHELHVESNNQGMSNSILTPKMHKDQYPHIKFNDVEKISVTTLDKWIEVNEDSVKRNILVMDVQGYEFNVLLGAIKALEEIDLIVTEVNRAELYENCAFITEMDVFLRNFGFRRIVTNWEGRTWGDAIYIREEVLRKSGYAPQFVNLIDNRFKHSKNVLGFDSICLVPPARFDWNREFANLSPEDTVVVTDDLIHQSSDLACKKIALIIEPRSIDKNPYTEAQINRHKYSLIVSHDKEFIKTIDNGRYAPFGGTWIKPIDWRCFDKTKSVSIIASHKNFTRGHRLRHEVANLINENDRYGSAFNKIDYKLEGIRDYKFTVVIENEKIEGYFTEKLIDALITGTVPIYWGCPDVGEFFDTSAIIAFDTADELKKILSDQTILDEFFDNNFDAIKNNAAKARRFASVDENFLNAIVGLQ
jgi:FkbM family methyltransferase